jgi:molecular chaperone DnaK
VSKVIGIDLGTTNSVVAVLEGNQADIVANANGSRTTPSVVSLGPGDDWLVGEVAKRQLATRPDATIYSIKRLMGMRFDEVPDDVERLPVKVVKGENGMACVEIEGQVLSPVEISAMVLRTLRDRAEEVLGEDVSQAVITVPAYFNDAQRQATKDAGRVAGLDVLRIVNEPTAAALAYGLDRGKVQDIAVFDLGGGTFDISILHLGEGVFEVHATGGDTHLGGDDFDQAIIDWMIEEFREQTGVDLSGDRSVKGRLKEAAERAKVELSAGLESQIQLPFVAQVDGDPVHLDLTLTRARFERMVQPLIDRTLECCLSALEDAGMTPMQIDEIILVGGATRMPAVQRAVEELFAKMPNKGVHPDEVVAMGAAIQAGVLDGEVEDVLLLDVTPLSLGLETLGGVVTRVIDRNTTVPTRRSQVFSTVQDNQSSVTVHCVQGEREMAVDNRTLARFELSGIPPAKKGVPQIEVVFDIDANGILNISARDLGTGQEQNVVVSGAGNLSETEIERLVREAEERHDEDVERRERAELRHRAESLLLNVRDSVASARRSGVDPTVVSGLEGLCDTLEDALVSDEPDRLKVCVEELQQAAHGFAQTLYQSRDS